MHATNQDAQTYRNDFVAKKYYVDFLTSNVIINKFWVNFRLKCSSLYGQNLFNLISLSVE